ncbi:probable receptor-like serine/threonine-protein kinase At5g57670 isoform X2 [Elaeis guineensis]|uniref:Probable receptor-like serine/threonine-protein kinase At5g57670 isoform X2 n=1 Tax=Elaeis guineensis var. tenera TaxID=51953 RepID=A0A6I9QQF9_ELAGV|nr:probable receptor-like serine/threonine-protein kinase At5g57670 isoform X2 [Elaeis guineensis]
MDSTEERALSSKILVGISLDARASSELLSWAVGNAAHPNDTIVALHVLVGKGEKKINSDMTRLRQAKAFVISMLGEFTEICETKQVKLEAKVRSSSSIGRGLTAEAALIDANFLLVGGSRNSSQRNSYEITKYCLKYAPEGCSVIAVGKQGLPQNDTYLDSLTCEENQSLSSRWNSKNLHVDGPEGENAAPEECFSPSSNETSSRSRTGIWRRLSIAKLFFRSTEHLAGKETDGCSTYTEDQKPSWRCFSYEEISRATNNFHPENMVGRGGYAEVFKGKLYNGQAVAVKRLAKGNTCEQKEKEFLAELGIIGHVCHPNTAFLIGCCIENGLHLIFDFSPNGSLASALHGKNGEFLEWPVRYKIAIGTARGLHYLHKCCRRRIIHRDIKASNVLLGPEFEPQISDFGLAKWLPKQWTHHCVIPIEGTFGYLAPEYFMHGIVDEKTDVFAFGVLLLEIVTGRRPVDSSKQSLLLWAKPLIDTGRVDELADPKLEGKYDLDQLQKLVLTASYCVRQTSIWRPSMSEVLQLLTDCDDSKVAESWRMPESQIDEMDDWSLGTDFCYPY